MAKTISNTRVVGVKPSSVGELSGTFFSVIGLIVAISTSLTNTVHWTQETQSILRGFTFGMASGIVMIIVMPFIYFVIGWLIGLLYGVIINAVLKASGGLIVETAADKGDK